jgi:hypothetical protein
MNHSEILCEYIRSHPTFKIITTTSELYDHMGATLTDAVLQAGVNYKSVVFPRVQRLLTDHPQAENSSTFLQLLEEHGPSTLLNFNNKRKMDTLLELTRLLVAQAVETENDFRTWIAVQSNFDRLFQIKGIKNKTADYLKILLGMGGVAIDVHLYRFLFEADLPTTDYETARALICDAAILLDVDATQLDYSIWRYMSERRIGSWNLDAILPNLPIP